jgi:hypothetical protein
VCVCVCVSGTRYLIDDQCLCVTPFVFAPPSKIQQLLTKECAQLNSSKRVDRATTDLNRRDAGCGANLHDLLLGSQMRHDISQHKRLAGSCRALWQQQQSQSPYQPSTLQRSKVVVPCYAMHTVKNSDRPASTSSTMRRCSSDNNEKSRGTEVVACERCIESDQ